MYMLNLEIGKTKIHDTLVTKTWYLPDKTEHLHGENNSVNVSLTLGNVV